MVNQVERKKGVNDRDFTQVYNNLNRFSGVSGESDFLTADTLISTISTGTAPLTITSTTMSPNLNADMLDGSHLSELCRFISSTDFTGETSVTISGLTSPAKYRLFIGFIQNTTDGAFILNVNNDATAATYAWASMAEAPTGPGGQASNSDIHAHISHGTDNVNATGMFNGSLDLEGISATLVIWHGTTFHQLGIPNWAVTNVGGRFINGSLSSLVFSTTAGTMTGNIKVYQY